MKHYIDKATVVAEIERRIKTNKECMLGLRNLDYYQGKVDALNDTLSLLDTIETKEVDEEYNGKAMLHVLEKGVEQGRRELIDKACKWLKKWDAYRVCLEGRKDWFIEQFKKAMKE
jgi:hypothetical protein